MNVTEKALANGWGWVLGESGSVARQPSANYAAAAETVDQALSVIAQRLGLPGADFEQILNRIAALQEEHRRALRSVAAARYAASIGT